MRSLQAGSSRLEEAGRNWKEGGETADTTCMYTTTAHAQGVEQSLRWLVRGGGGVGSSLPHRLPSGSGDLICRQGRGAALTAAPGEEVVLPR